MVGRPLLLRVRMLPAETTTADVTELAERLLGCCGGCGCWGGAATEGRGTYCNRKKRLVNTRFKDCAVARFWLCWDWNFLFVKINCELIGC